MRMNLDQVKDMGRKGRGRSELIKHLEGKRLTARQAGLAKCYDCQGFYSDGRMDCGIKNCALHPLMPYRGKSEDLTAP
jgi:hypothetical protein